MRRGVYYTKSALLSNANADLALRSKHIRRLAQKPISDVIAKLSQQPITALDEADLKLATKNIIYVMNSGGQPNSSKASRLLAIHSAQSGRNVVLYIQQANLRRKLKRKQQLKVLD